MGWSLKLGTIAGTEIRIHMTFVLLLVWIWLTHYQIGGAPAAWEGVAFILSVFVCVVLHEFGHIAAARRLGSRQPTSRFCRSAASPGSSEIQASQGKNC